MPYIVDTNVLLHGFFNPNSFSYSFIKKMSKDDALYVVENSLDEAYTIMHRAKNRTGVDLNAGFDYCLMKYQLMALPKVSRTDAKTVSGVNGIQDKAIAFSSKKYDISISTCDVGDFRRAKKNGVHALSPEQAIGGSLDHCNIFPGYLCSQSEGAIYTELTPTWVDRKLSLLGNRKYYLFSIENFLAAYFDAQEGGLVVSILGEQKTLRINSVSKDETPVKIVFSYKRDKGLLVYYGYRGKRIEVPCTWDDIVLPETVQVGSDSQGNNQIEGNVRLFSGLPIKLSEKGANNLLDGKTLASPFDRLSLEDVINLYYK